LEAPRLYGAVLLWLLSELFEHLPEVGDLPQPKLVFFFDEAHLLFAQASPALVERVEQVVRLVRSKGVGVYFVTQNPLDIPEKVLGQLGNRVQHALRAFTPRDQKAVRAAAQTMRANPALDAERVIGDLGVGEALVSFLDDRGRPQPVERAMIVPPGSRLGPLGDAERRAVLAASPVAGVYEQALDRVSAYECLQEGAVRAREALASVDAQRPSRDEVGADRGARGRPRADSLLEAVAKSAARSVASTVGRELVRGLLGTLLGHGRRR
jgi:DNA helicase HerA-like ATPase